MTIKKKATVKKKSARKKTVVKKKTAVRAARKEVINHDPFAVLDTDTSGSVGAVIQSEEKRSPEVIPEEAGEVYAKEQAVMDVSLASTEQEVQDMTEQVVPEGNDDNRKADVNLGSNLTVVDAEAQKIELLSVISDQVPVRLIAEDIEQVDGAGLQLLAAFFKEAKQKEVDVSWGNVSSALLDAVKMLGLTDVLNLQDAEQDDGEGTAWGLF